MSFVKIWIHAVWATKNAEPLLEKSIRKKLYPHILQNAKEKGIHIDFINGYVEHVHCLLWLGASQSISEIMHLIKGESSSWMNAQNLIEGSFRWQREYYAVSVSESMVEKVRNYIRIQEAHHKRKSFVEEEKEMVKRYGFTKTSG